MKKLFLLILLITANSLYAKIWLPSILSDNMVLQQNSEATLWGWTTAVDETITISASWNKEKISVKAPIGFWSVKIPTPKAGGPYTITISGHEEIKLENILIGEVWLSSGQSNMEWTPLMGLNNAEEEINMANFPNVRLFNVLKKISSHPQDDLLGKWELCTPETMKDFSSAAYFFGRKLHRELNIPIGLINSSWGGTNVEVWIPEEVLKQQKELLKSIDKIDDFPWWPKKAGLAYNAMIHPLLNYNIAGAIWYQGESNRANAHSYKDSFSLMIETWRDLWQKDFPFYFVQIAPFNYGSKTNHEGALVQEAQLLTMRNITKTGMVVTNDIGNLKNIHPKNKQDVGKRLAFWALAKTYGLKGIAYSGPIYENMEIVKKKIQISFQHAESGLFMKGKELEEFYLAGEDKIFYKAKAKIVKNKVYVSSKKVKKPVAVRFAYSEMALPNLYNKEGLPAAGFRTDNWEIKL